MSFLSENNFRRIDTINKVAAAIFSNDELSIKDMNMFFEKNKIIKHKELYFKRENNFLLIADKKRNTIWGLIEYGE